MMNPGKVPRRRAGFALILTIVLLALLVLAVYALSVLVRVDSQIVTASADQARARQHALLGLQIAFGELQRTAGPDDRVTAMAGMMGVPVESTLRHWCGVWRPGAGSPEAWLSSGAADVATARIDDAFAALQIVRAGSVTIANGGREFVEVGVVPIGHSAAFGSLNAEGNYAFWVGDEGTKISAVLRNSQMQTGGVGSGFRPNVGRILPSLRHNEQEAENLISYEQLRHVAPGGDLKTPFHELTLVSRHLPASIPGAVSREGGYVYGGVNLNTTRRNVWRALLESGTSAAPLLDCAGKEESLATRIAADLEKLARPLMSVDDLAELGVIQKALDTRSPKVSTTSQEEILATLGPYLAVRSDTFRIRAYGDAVNPVDGTTASAAYCEAMVQRTGVMLPGGLGRKFVVTSFRWLGADDI